MNKSYETYAAMLIRKRGLDADLKEVNAEIASLEPTVLNLLLEDQIKHQEVRVGDESITLHIHTQLWPRAKANGSGQRDTGSVTKVLKRCGLSDLVTEGYHAGSLAAYVRERLGNGQRLQPTLAGVLDLNEVRSVRGRRTPIASESKSAKAIKNLRR